MKMKGSDGTIEVEREADKGHNDRVMSHPVGHISISFSLSLCLSVLHYHFLCHLSVCFDS